MGDISCESCTAACCRDITMMLSAEERDMMLEGGNRLRAMTEPVGFDRPWAKYPLGVNVDEEGRMTAWHEDSEAPEPVPAGFGRYILLGACKFLMNDNGWQYCGNYDRRPAACRDFPEGGPDCINVRMIKGVDSPIRAMIQLKRRKS